MQQAQESIASAQRQRQQLIKEGERRAEALAAIAMGGNTEDSGEKKDKRGSDPIGSTDSVDFTVGPFPVKTTTIKSDKAVCLVSTHQDVTVVAFRGTSILVILLLEAVSMRHHYHIQLHLSITPITTRKHLSYVTTLISSTGTKDPMDVLTDISFNSESWDLSAGSASAGDGESVRVKAHAGFLAAFKGLQADIATILSAADTRGLGGPNQHKVVFTGHSMGGALAQLAAAYFSQYAHL